MTILELKNLIRECLQEELQNQSLTESSLTAEEKVDAWHNGTRRENYKAAGIPKLNTFLEIAKSKGYDEIVSIIEGELDRRGVNTTTSIAATPNTTNVTSDPVTTTVDPAATPDTVTTTDTAATIDATSDGTDFSDALVQDQTPAVTLSNKELDALLGMAIQRFGTSALSAHSVWKSAGGFIGSYSLIWRNSSGNPVKPDRAIDRAMDLAYDHNKLIVLVSYFHGGYQNIDRYYSINVPSSTTYIVDRGDIYRKARESYSYYDSELDWNFYTLTKTKANFKKLKLFILEKVPSLTDAEAEKIATDFFNK